MPVENDKSRKRLVLFLMKVGELAEISNNAKLCLFNVGGKEDFS